jgi:hypothetical protein
MSSYGVLRRVNVVRTDISEELSTSIIRVTRATRRNIPEDAILHTLACFQFLNLSHPAETRDNVTCKGNAMELLWFSPSAVE